MPEEKPAHSFSSVKKLWNNSAHTQAPQGFPLYLERPCVLIYVLTRTAYFLKDVTGRELLLFLLGIIIIIFIPNNIW